MSERRQPKVLDLVAVTHCPPAADVQVGDVGTVVELLPPDAAEVELLDRDGRTRCITTLPQSDLLVLNRERTKVAETIRMVHA